MFIDSHSIESLQNCLGHGERLETRVSFVGKSSVLKVGWLGQGLAVFYVS